MLLYLDLNSFNRLFDDQSQQRVARETAAVFSILEQIIDDVDQLAWSVVLDFENSQHPMADRRNEIGRWARHANTHAAISEQVFRRAEELTEAGFNHLDAAHLACAESAGCGYFLTCDDRLTRTAGNVALSLRVQNPVEYLEEHTDA